MSISSEINIDLDPTYRPNEDEEFMNEQQQAYFKKKLYEWRAQLLHESAETIHHLQQENTAEPDILDSAANETDRSLELRARDRARKLINKIDDALLRIDDGSYGYCEETGEPIGLRRLEARPIAIFTVEAQERHEKKERVYREE